MRKRDPLERFYEKVMVDPNSGCHLWTGHLMHKGYGFFRYSHAEKERLAHRFAWRFAHGNVPEGMHVLHKCDTPACVNPDHLFLGTNDDNCRDKVSKKRQAMGENHAQAKFTTAEIYAIRAYEGPNKPLARMFGVDPSTTRKIRNGTYWRSV